MHYYQRLITPKNDMAAQYAMYEGVLRVRKDGNVFGIAAEFDKQRIYYHVNGNWMTGKPGSGDGIKLKKMSSIGFVHMERSSRVKVNSQGLSGNFVTVL